MFTSVPTDTGRSVTVTRISPGCARPRSQLKLTAMRNMWKWIGLAGLVGVAAGGVLVARDQRKRNAYSPDEIRARLHQRLDQAGDSS